MNKNIKYSQNFLTSEKVLNQIIKQLNLKETDTVYEIGTGKGHLTTKLAKISKQVTSIELDSHLFNLSSEKLKLNINDKIRMYEKSKITMYKHTFFFVYFYWRYTKMEKLITQLRILKEMNLKPNYSALAREYGCDRRTVKKYNNGYTGGGNTRNKKSKLDKYLPIIQEKLQYKGIHIKSVYEFLIDKFSFENIGTYSNFHKYVVKHKLLVNKNTSKTVRFETLPGKQAQVDWKEDITMISKYGEIFKFNVFSFKLGNSRYVYYEYRKEKTREDLFECLINAFKFIGGVPQEILFDNMSSVVDVNTGKINSKFLAFSKDMDLK